MKKLNSMKKLIGAQNSLQLRLGQLLADLNGDVHMGILQNEVFSDDERESERGMAVWDMYAPQLRSAVDEWLASGFSEDGKSEQPFERTVSLTSSVFTLMHLWLKDHPYKDHIEASGEVRHVQSREKWPQYELPADRARDLVGWQLVSLLEDSYKWSLAKCGLCKRYYFRQKPRRKYERTTYCSRCRSSGSAARRMKEKRDQARTNGLALAAEAFQSWTTLAPSTRKKWNGDERAYIASKVADLGFTQTWVSRNMTVIEEQGRPRELTRVARAHGKLGARPKRKP